MQAGGNSVTVAEAAPTIGGYGVHASKIRRYGAKILAGTTIKSASGNGVVNEATLISVDEKFNAIPGTEIRIAADLVAIAVGLTPLMELLRMLGCKFVHSPILGGWIPLHNKRLETTVSGVYIAGDVSGIEEASTAMEEGRLAAWSVLEDLGYKSDFCGMAVNSILARLEALRSGPFGLSRHHAKESIYAALEAR
jgi:thioredoxin reductase